MPNYNIQRRTLKFKVKGQLSREVVKFFAISTSVKRVFKREVIVKAKQRFDRRHFGGIENRVTLRTITRIYTMADNSIVVQKLREFLLFLQLCCIFVIGNTLLRLSYAKRITSSIMENAAGMALPEKIFHNSLFTREMMKALWEVYTLDMKKSASYGQKAPDPTLVDPSTGEEKHLSKALDVRKLQVLAFGSYTCPVFRWRFTELQALAEEFHHVADFSVIYIDEAHPSDGWAFKVRLAFNRIFGDSCSLVV